VSRLLFAFIIQVAVLLLWPTLDKASEAESRGAIVEPTMEGRCGRALLVGVNDYEHLKDLRFCEEDMKALQERLVEVGFDRGAVKCLTTGDGDPALRPSVRNVNAQLDSLFAGLDEKSVIVIALAGHGGAFKWKNAAGAEKTESFFCPHDACLGSPGATMVSVQGIYQRMEKSKARFKLLVTDACRDPHLVPAVAPMASRYIIDEAKAQNGFADSIRSLGTPERLPKGSLAILSCSSGERSWEEPNLGHGVFTYFLLEALSGKADREYRGNSDGMVSYLEFQDYVYRKTSEHVWKTHNGAKQTPSFQANWEQPDFALVRARVPSLDPPQITNALGMRLNLIPAGDFTMGDQGSAEKTARLFQRFGAPSPDSFVPEYPPHRVRINRPFYLGVTEVTVEQFRRFVDETKYKTDAEREGKGGRVFDKQSSTFVARPECTWRGPGRGQSDSHPVVLVSWNDAMAFCHWLTRKENRTYRLPTEAEWEYACRAGTQTQFSQGDDPEDLASFGNVADASAKASYPNLTGTISGRDGYASVAPVGRFKPNAFGLYDMHGNVLEWCADWCEPGYYAQSPIDDPRGPPSGSWRVLRGGSWINFPAYCRSAYRDRGAPTGRYDNIGFRVLRLP
jgi:formylglycine-generating enzyme required for sulfatase activity